MAEAAVESSRFFCHSCSRHFATNSSEFRCPHCQSGFVEQIEQDSNLSSDVDVEGGSRDGPSALDMLRGSLSNYWPMTSPPDQEPDSVSFFSINLRPEPGSPRGQQSSGTSDQSSRNSGPATRYNFRIRARRRPPRQQSQPQQANQGDANLLLEGFLQQLMNGADPQALFEGGNFFGNFGNMFPIHGNPGDYAWGEGGLDNIITELLGQLDNSGPPPASPTAIKELPVLTITEEHVVAKKDCSVCMETFIIDAKVKRLPCEHFFHIDCIDPWLELHNTCPICRKNIEDFGSCPIGANHGAQTTSGPSSSGV